MSKLYYFIVNLFAKQNKLKKIFITLKKCKIKIKEIKIEEKLTDIKDEKSYLF